METLDKHFRTLTKAAFEKHGFQSADLLSHWTEIAGPETAVLCTPERITWSRPRDTGASPSGTLSLRTAPGRALDVQYAVETIRDRINAYLGYAAIARIKVIPGSAPAPVGATGHMAPPSPDTPPPAALTALEDDGLKQALNRLRDGIIKEKPRSPQGQ